MTAPRTNTAGLFTFPPDIHWSDSIFDDMMVSRCAFYRREGTTDQYGNLVAIFEQIDIQTLTGLPLDMAPCLARHEKGKKLNTPTATVMTTSETSFGLADWVIFMRPVLVDDPPLRVSIEHWLQVLSPADLSAGAILADPNDANSGAIMYEIVDVINPAQMDHHIEIHATVREA
jgi:hypothetical protein